MQLCHHHCVSFLLSTWPWGTVDTVDGKDLPASAGRSPRPVRHIVAAAGRDWSWPALVPISVSSVNSLQVVTFLTRCYHMLSFLTRCYKLLAYLALVHLHIFGCRCFYFVHK